MPAATAPSPGKRPRENRTRYVVLGMLTAGPLTGYALRQRIDRTVGHFWQESYGQLYPALRRLAAEGLVDARAARGGPGRGVTSWAITRRGRAALAAWLALPPVLEPERNEVLLKVFFARAGAPEVTARNLEGVAAAVRAQHAELEEVARRLEVPAVACSPDAPYWKLTLDFGVSILRTSLEWLERAQGELRAKSARRGEREPISRPPRRPPAHRPEGTR